LTYPIKKFKNVLPSESDGLYLQRGKMRPYSLLVVLLLSVASLIGTTVMASDAPEENNQFPYQWNMAPYVEKTMENRSFWFQKDTDDCCWEVDWDKERKPFAKVIIHHTGGSPDQEPAEMEDVNKEKYIARYDSDDNDPYVKGLEPHSSHVVNGKETFLPYHYLVYENGTTVDWLEPLTLRNGIWYIDMVAWHAGNWSVNCESISVCLVGNYSVKEPTVAQKASLERLIANLRYYNADLEVLPHYAINQKTDCPGPLYENWSRGLNT
jgi:hypothetical protein